LKKNVKKLKIVEFQEQRYLFPHVREVIVKQIEIQTYDQQNEKGWGLSECSIELERRLFAPQNQK